jgi:hypothetical protein
MHLTAEVRNVTQSTTSLLHYTATSPSIQSLQHSFTISHNQAAIAQSDIHFIPHDYYALPKVCCALLLHQAVGNSSSYCHVIAAWVDRSIRKRHPHLECCFIQISSVWRSGLFVFRQFFNCPLSGHKFFLIATAVTVQKWTKNTKRPNLQTLQIRPKLVSCIGMRLPDCDRCYNQSAKGISFNFLVCFLCFHKFGLQ